MSTVGRRLTLKDRSERFDNLIDGGVFHVSSEEEAGPMSKAWPRS
jgi:hypothetical protein